MASGTGGVFVAPWPPWPPWTLSQILESIDSLILCPPPSNFEPSAVPVSYSFCDTKNTKSKLEKKLSKKYWTHAKSLLQQVTAHKFQSTCYKTDMKSCTKVCKYVVHTIQYMYFTAFPL